MHIIRHPAFRWFMTIVLLGLIGYQLWTRSDHFQKFTPQIFAEAGWYLILVIVLMPVNWWLETLKWHGLLQVHDKVPFGRAFKAVTGGIALSLFTPNRIGEYGGRILFMPYAIRWRVALSTLMGSVSQNLVAFIAGIISFVLLFKGFIYIKIVGLLVIPIVTICFFNMKSIVKWVCSLKLHSAFSKLAGHLAYIDDYNNPILIRSLVIALCRYIVYTSQFVLLLHAFEPQAHIMTLFLGVSALYLFHTLIPMPPVTDVLARTNIALILWSGAGMSELSISLASFIVWIINLLIPAVIGCFAMSTMHPQKSLITHDQYFSPSYEPAISDQSGNKT